MDEKMAANAAADPAAAGEAEENPASSQEETPVAAGQRKGGAEGGAAGTGSGISGKTENGDQDGKSGEKSDGESDGGNGGNDVTQTQAFARRLREETDKLRPFAEFVQEMARSGGFDDPAAFMERTRALRERAGLSEGEKALLEKERDSTYRALREQGAPHEAALAFANRQMNERGAAMADHARSAAAEKARSRDEREKLEKTVGELTRKVEELTAQKEAREESRAAAQAGIGPAAGEAAADKDFYTSEEYDRLPQARKDELFESGRIFQMMARWVK